jgi:hypothetical protein
MSELYVSFWIWAFSGSIVFSFWLILSLVVVGGSIMAFALKGINPATSDQSIIIRILRSATPIFAIAILFFTMFIGMNL